MSAAKNGSRAVMSGDGNTIETSPIHKSYECKKLSTQARDKLDEIALGVDLEDLFTAYREGRDQRGRIGDQLWFWLADSFPDLKEVLKADREVVERILSEEYERVKKKKEQGSPDSILERVIRYVSQACELVADQYGDGYAISSTQNNMRAVKLRSREFKLFAGRLLWAEEERGVSSEVLNSALNTLEGLAIYEGRHIFLYNRLAALDGSIFYDMSDANGRVVKIDANGWRFVSKAPLLFRREQHQQPQVEPMTGGDIGLLWRYVNLNEESDRVLFLAFLVASFFAELDHPIVLLHGDQGSGKSFSTECVKALLDPSALQTSALSSDEESVILTLYHNWLSAFDNVGDEIRDWQSQILARAVTGAGQSRRRRYTDEEEVLYNFRRVILINSITVPLSAPDVMDRALLFKMARFQEHGLKRELEANFARDRPAILGGLFDLVSKTLKRLEVDGAKIEIPPGLRLADFARIGEAVARTVGQAPGTFCEFYLRKKASDNLEVIQSSVMGSVLYTLITDGGWAGAGDEYYDFLDENEQWSGSPSELLEIFNSKAAELRIDRRVKEWRGSPKGLVTVLDKLKTNLAALGVVIDRGREHTGRFVQIRLTKTSPFYNLKNCHNRHNRHGDSGRDASDEKKRYKRGRFDESPENDGESADSVSESDNVSATEPVETAVTNNKHAEHELRDLILDYVPRFTERDKRGAHIDVVVNKIARSAVEFTKEDAEKEVTRLIDEGLLVEDIYTVDEEPLKFVLTPHVTNVKNNGITGK